MAVGSGSFESAGGAMCGVVRAQKVAIGGAGPRPFCLSPRLATPRAAKEQGRAMLVAVRAVRLWVSGGAMCGVVRAQKVAIGGAGPRPFCLSPRLATPRAAKEQGRAMLVAVRAVRLWVSGGAMCGVVRAQKVAIGGAGPRPFCLSPRPRLATPRAAKEQGRAMLVAVRAVRLWVCKSIGPMGSHSLLLTHGSAFAAARR
ncbi:hypothetical protein NDU88_010388 [Pleurodeles waltl]|uniref:Uncharacterized protein n=1 Tax=Pleurodeles waltl TaxID=8319 RepID=A0AAV7Q1S8_PLEWA|nr:hypothetical protein NDU88_010388 [Pleurodeles waltl]